MIFNVDIASYSKVLSEETPGVDRLCVTEFLMTSLGVNILLVRILNKCYQLADWVIQGRRVIELFAFLCSKP